MAKAFSPQLDIRFRDDATVPSPSQFPEYDEAEGIELTGALIAGNATMRGRTAVTLYFTDDKGKKYFATTSARILANGLASAIKGFATRVGDNLNEA